MSGTAKTLEVRGSVWHHDDDEPDGGHLVVATAAMAWEDEDDLTLDIVREDAEPGVTFYLSPDQAKDLIVAIAAALAS